MKKIILSFIALTFVTVANAQAPDFTATDCNSVSHNLYTELNAGKVVVIAWVMPCASCIAPTLSAQTQVQTFQSSYPGKVIFYLSDDVANTNCATLSSWASTNGISTTTIFSDANLSEAPYGTAGMPKIVVIGGGSTHTIYFNQNNGLDVTAFNAAINQALNATGIEETTKPFASVNTYPTPADQQIHITFDLSSQETVHASLINLQGAVVRTLHLSDIGIGEHTVTMDVADLRDGSYTLRLDAGLNSKSIRCIVLHENK